MQVHAWDLHINGGSYQDSIAKFRMIIDLQLDEVYNPFLLSTLSVTAHVRALYTYMYVSSIMEPYLNVVHMCV